MTYAGKYACQTVWSDGDGDGGYVIESSSHEPWVLDREGLAAQAGMLGRFNPTILGFVAKEAGDLLGRPGDGRDWSLWLVGDEVEWLVVEETDDPFVLLAEGEGGARYKITNETLHETRAGGASFHRYLVEPA